MSNNVGQAQYGTGADSSIGSQLVDFLYHRKAIIETVKERVFSQLADTMTMPKHHGKEIKAFRYIPMLDDRNINDQGIDATGASQRYEYGILLVDQKNDSEAIVAEATTEAAAKTALEAKVVAWAGENGIAGATYAAVITALEAGGVTVIDRGEAVPASGNLYGSSKDIGYMKDRMPALNEHGGRVNRVGNTRITIKGTMYNYGMFEEYTRDSLDFDSDKDLYMHISRESIRAANEITEDLLQIDLINNAGVTMFGGSALTVATLDDTSSLSYGLLVKAEQVLDQNNCPKATKLVTGSTLTDTKTIDSARYIYCGSEIKHSLLSMKDFHDSPAFVPVHKYADATNTAAGEIGSIGGFRFIEAKEMTKWSGVGANATNTKYYSTDGKYDVFPLLVVGSGSFTTIGFASQKGSKFEIISRKPGVANATQTDPYGKTGFFSTQFWYGFMALRPEWIACIKVTAPKTL